MSTDVQKSEIHELLKGHPTHYEVRPYYVVWGRYPEGAPPIEQRVQAGFTVDVYAAVENCQFPIFETEQARRVMDYFGSLAQETQEGTGHGCTVEVIPYEDSLVLDTQKQFEPQAMVQIRISHHRGLDQPEGPAEEQALKAVCDALRELGARES
jgi:hypothetical protein